MVCKACEASKFCSTRFYGLSCREILVIYQEEKRKS
jgi:hypothetical protein